MVAIAELQQLLGQSMMLTFGHPYLMGAVMFVLVAFVLSKSNFSPGSSMVVSYFTTIVLIQGTFMPEWIWTMTAILIGIVLGLAYMRFFR